MKNLISLLWAPKAEDKYKDWWKVRIGDFWIKSTRNNELIITLNRLKAAKFSCRDAADLLVKSTNGCLVSRYCNRRRVVVHECQPLREDGLREESPIN